MWRSGSSVLHELPPGHKLYSSRMRSVLQDLRTSDLRVLQLLGGHDAFARAYTILLYVIEVGSIAMRAMALVVCFCTGSGKVQGPVASSLAVFWDFGSLFRVVVDVRQGDFRQPGWHRRHHGWTWPRSPSGLSGALSF